MMYNREKMLVWNFTHKEQIKLEIWFSIKIKTISHETWQTSTFQISRALQKTMTKMIKKRFKSEVIESCYNLYRNSWFLIKKKKTRWEMTVSFLWWIFNRQTVDSFLNAEDANKMTSSSLFSKLILTSTLNQSTSTHQFRNKKWICSINF